MSVESNKLLVRRHLDLSWNKGDIDGLDEVWAPDAVLHLPGGATLTGAETIKQYLRSAVDVYADRQIVIDDLVGEGDKVSARWTFSGVQVGETRGVAPTNRMVTITGMDFYRASGGKLVEEWFEFNGLGLMQQLSG